MHYVKAIRMNSSYTYKYTLSELKKGKGSFWDSLGTYAILIDDDVERKLWQVITVNQQLHQKRMIPNADYYRSLMPPDLYSVKGLNQLNGLAEMVRSSAYSMVEKIYQRIVFTVLKSIDENSKIYEWNDAIKAGSLTDTYYLPYIENFYYCKKTKQVFGEYVEQGYIKLIAENTDKVLLKDYFRELRITVPDAYITANGRILSSNIFEEYHKKLCSFFEANGFIIRTQGNKTSETIYLSINIPL